MLEDVCTFRGGFRSPEFVVRDAIPGDPVVVKTPDPSTAGSEGSNRKDGGMTGRLGGSD